MFLLARILVSAVALGAMIGHWNLLWGLEPARLVPGGRLLAVLVLVLAWIPPRRLPGSTNDRIRLAGCLLLLGLLVATWTVFPSDSIWFGDSNHILEDALEGRTVTGRSPLYSLLVRGLAGRIHPETEAFVSALRWVSVGTGILFLGIAGFYWRRRMGRLDPAGLALGFGGYLVVFQGHIESYALFFPVLLAYLWALVEPPSRSRSLRLGVLQAIGILTHSIAFLLLPVTLWGLAGRGARSRLRTAALPTAGAMLVALVLLVLAGVRAEGDLAYLNPLRIVDLAREQFFTPQPWNTEGGPLFTTHLLHVGNGILFSIGPAAIFVLAVAAGREGRSVLAAVLRSPLGVVAWVFLAVRLWIQFPLGPVMDWDLISVFLFPWVVVALETWRRLDVGLRRMLPVPVLTGLLLWLPWASVNATEGRDIAFLRAHADGTPVPNTFVRSRLLFRSGLHEVEQGNLEHAVDLLERSITLVPNPHIARRAGFTWERLGEEDRALEAFERAVAWTPGDDDVLSYNRIGHLLIRRGDLEGAERAFTRAREIDPETLPALHNLGLIAERRGKQEEARAFFEEYVRRAEAREEDLGIFPRRFLVDVYRRLDRPADAARHLEVLVARLPEDREQWDILGRLYTALGNEEGRTRVERVQHYFRLLGIAMDEANRGSPETLEESLVIFDEAIAVWDTPEAHHAKAKVFVALGNRSRALMELRTALELDPGHGPSRMLLRQVQRGG